MPGHFEKGVWIEDKIIVEIWRYRSKDDEIECKSLNEAFNLFEYSDNCAMYCYINGKEVSWDEVERMIQYQRNP